MLLLCAFSKNGWVSDFLFIQKLCKSQFIPLLNCNQKHFAFTSIKKVKKTMFPIKYIMVLHITMTFSSDGILSEFRLFVQGPHVEMRKIPPCRLFTGVYFQSVISPCEILSI